VFTSLALQPARPLRVILTAGFVAGVLDGLDAALIITALNGVSAVRVFQFIASGLLGISSFRGGIATAALGVLLHFTIATAAAATFYYASLKLRFLVQRPLLWGPLYGVAIFFFMHYLIVPLSATPRQPQTSLTSIANLLFSHIFFVGIPIALITGRMQNITAE
jgi:hypothetical protein